MDERDSHNIISMRRKQYTDTHIIEHLLGKVKLSDRGLMDELKASVTHFKNSNFNDINSEIVNFLIEESGLEVMFQFTPGSMILRYYETNEEAPGLLADHVALYERDLSSDSSQEELLEELLLAFDPHSLEDWAGEEGIPSATANYYEIKHSPQFSQENLIKHAELAGFFVITPQIDSALEGVMNTVIFTDIQQNSREFELRWLPLFFSFFPALKPRYEHLEIGVSW